MSQIRPIVPRLWLGSCTGDVLGRHSKGKASPTKLMACQAGWQGGGGGAEVHISHLDSVLDVSQLQTGSKVFRRLGPPGSTDP